MSCLRLGQSGEGLACNWLTHGDLEAIDSHYRNPDDQLEQVLAKWLKGGEATWRQLTEALYSVPVGETALAKQIRMEHCQQGRLNKQCHVYYFLISHL